VQIKFEKILLPWLLVGVVAKTVLSLKKPKAVPRGENMATLVTLVAWIPCFPNKEGFLEACFA
jgi:hypothetical protein